MGVSADARERAADKIERLTRQPRDLVCFWRAVTELVSPVVPHFWAPCFFTVDPASLLITSHFHEGLDEFPPEALVAEYYGDDVHKLADVITSGVGDLHPARDNRW